MWTLSFKCHTWFVTSICQLPDYPDSPWWQRFSMNDLNNELSWIKITQMLNTPLNRLTRFQVSTCGRWRNSGSRRRGITLATMWPPSCRAVSPWSAATARTTLPSSERKMTGPIDRHPFSSHYRVRVCVCLCMWLFVCLSSSSVLENTCAFPFRFQPSSTNSTEVCVFFVWKLVTLRGRVLVVFACDQFQITFLDPVTYIFKIIYVRIINGASVSGFVLVDH